MFLRCTNVCNASKVASLIPRQRYSILNFKIARFARFSLRRASLDHQRQCVDTEMSLLSLVCRAQFGCNVKRVSRESANSLATEMLKLLLATRDAKRADFANCKWHRRPVRIARLLLNVNYNSTCINVDNVVILELSSNLRDKIRFISLASLQVFKRHSLSSISIYSLQHATSFNVKYHRRWFLRFVIINLN